jgi:hypothetical protein
LAQAFDKWLLTSVASGGVSWLPTDTRKLVDFPVEMEEMDVSSATALEDSMMSKLERELRGQMSGFVARG